MAKQERLHQKINKAKTSGSKFGKNKQLWFKERDQEQARRRQSQEEEKIDVANARGGRP